MFIIQFLPQILQVLLALHPFIQSMQKIFVVSAKSDTHKANAIFIEEISPLISQKPLMQVLTTLYQYRGKFNMQLTSCNQMHCQKVI